MRRSGRVRASRAGGRRATFALVCAAVLATSACADAGRSTTATPQPQTVSVAPPSPSPTPTPTRDERALQPGTNHNWAATPYVYDSAQVHDWMYGAKSASPSYPHERKIAFLTFDDGPTNTTPKVLDELARLQVPASFFIIAGPKGLGREGSPQLLQREIADGHSVCLHSYSHNYDQLYPGRHADVAAIVADHDKAAAAARDVLGQDFHANCQRYPGGHGWKGTAGSDVALQAQGVYWFDWTTDNGDGADHDPGTGAGRAKLALSKIEPGTNVVMVLMHDFRDNQATVDSIDPVVSELRAQGYEFGVLN